jgi:O-antigen/teichoic acid export membrane protein
MPGRAALILLNKGGQLRMTDSVGTYFDEHKETADLGRQALRGGSISVAVQYGNGVLQLLAAIFLARLLAPEDYGLVAIVTVLTGFAPSLIDFGLGDVTTQRSKITTAQISSLFWFSTGLGLAIALVVAASSPSIARIYRDPRLEPIALYTAITFVMYGVSNLHIALLRRTMKFGEIARIQLLGTLVGVVVALVMAFLGFGYWALVVRPIANALCVAIGAWTVCKWRPGVPVFDSEVKSMLTFGLHVVGFAVTYAVSRAADRIGLGLFYPPEILGYYQNAVLLFDYSIVLALAQVHTVGSAALSKLQSNPEALRQKYEAALSALAFFVMPTSAVLSVTAQDVTVLLLGEKWRAAGLFLSIIALRGMFQVIDGSQGWLHLAIGRADRWRNWGVVTVAAQILAVLVGMQFGPTGVAAGTVAAFGVIAVPAVVYAGRPVGIGARLVIRATGRQLLGAIVAAAAGWWLEETALADFSSILRIILLSGFCGAIYLIIVAGLFRLVQPIRIAAKVIQDQMRKDRPQ